jgi:hypothetical protein
MLKTIVTAITLAVSLLAAQSTEAQEGSFLVSCVVSPVSTCAAAGNPGNPTWFIPAFGENEPGVESTMRINFPGFTYDQWSANGGPRNPRPDFGGYLEVLDPDGSRSDVVELFGFGASIDNRIESGPTPIRAPPSALMIY